MTTIEDEILFDLLYPNHNSKMEQQQNNHEVGTNGKQ